MLDDDLVARLAGLREAVTASVAARRVGDDDAVDAFRGLYIDDAEVDRLLTGADGPVHRMHLERAPVGSVIARLSDRFELDELDVGVLIVAAAPDLDSRYERLYGYLHDDVTRRRGSPGLAIELCGSSPADTRARLAVSPSGRLALAGLVEISEQDRPFLTRTLRVPDRVLDHLLGDDTPELDLLEVAVPSARRSGELSRSIATALRGGTRLIHLRERTDQGGLGVAVSALAEATVGGPVCVDLRRAPIDDRARIAALAVREARLIGGGLVVIGYHEIEPWIRRVLGRALAPTIVIGADLLDPDDTEMPSLALDVEATTQDEQAAAWLEALGSSDVEPPAAVRLAPSRIWRAVASARQHAIADDRPLNADHLAIGARRQNSPGLERLSRRIEPVHDWDDLVLNEGTAAQLRQLTDRVALRHQVLDGWQMRRPGRGEGVVALFAGSSGTGKTLAAEVVSAQLGLALYVIDLATVVDKYIGETEKNLDRIFTEAEGVNAVLLFDEADALFGKRSEVSDARDRYANIEVAYLLQRMETFDGLGILTTNMRSSLDEAFARRLAMVIDFPEPDEVLRGVLWRQMLSDVPLDDDVDLAFCAERFELSGGNIRNIAVAAAFLGAAGPGVVRMRDIIVGVRHEYQKLGRLCLEREFGPYHHLTRGDHGTHDG